MSHAIAVFVLCAIGCVSRADVAVAHEPASEADRMLDLEQRIVELETSARQRNTLLAEVSAEADDLSRKLDEEKLLNRRLKEQLAHAVSCER